MRGALYVVVICGGVSPPPPYTTACHNRLHTPHSSHTHSWLTHSFCFILPVFCCSKGEWSEVEVPLSRFMLTWKGRVVEEVVELNAKRITSLGISLAGGEQLQQEVRRGVG